jgi:HD-like signal output (HDOD) protein
MGLQNNIDALLAGIDMIPTLPAIVGQVTKTMVDPESSARDVMEIIRPDQALTLKILKIANSAFYGRVREASTLEQALGVLGFDEIRDLVISTAVFNNFHNLKATPLYSAGKLWKHSFVCGLAARIIAREMKLSESELYVAGLIHDMGKLAICMVLPQEFSTIVRVAGKDNLKTTLAELKILGITHAEVGLRLANRWMLPHDLAAAVGYHHRPAAAPAQTIYPKVIHMADLLAHNATAKEAPVDKQSQDGLSTTGVSSLTKSLWPVKDPVRVKKITAELEVQMKAHAGILEALLS